MGNCQAIDSATLVIQHPNGRVDKLYWPVSASEIMKMNPGHYVALLLTTTLYSSPTAAAAAAAKTTRAVDSKNTPLRITRIKLLRPTDTLALGHVYRLVASKEVMKGLWAKKQAKKQQQLGGADKITAEKISPEFEAEIRKNEIVKAEKVRHERQRSRNNTAVNSGISKSRGGWQPSLKAISEAAS